MRISRPAAVSVLCAAAALLVAGPASAAVSSKYYVAFVKFDQTINSSNGRPGNSIVETYSVVLKSAPVIRYNGPPSDRSVFLMKSVKGRTSARVVETQVDAANNCTLVATTVASRFSVTSFPLIWFRIAGGLLQPFQTTTTGSGPSVTTYSGCAPIAPRTGTLLALSGAVNVYEGIDGLHARSFGAKVRLKKVVRDGDDVATVRTVILPCPGSRRCTNPPGSAAPFG